jgi:hypothetical protein
MEISKTYKAEGKSLQAFIAPNTSHYKLQWSTGGKIPASLEGMYTSLFFVDTAVTSYLNSIPKEKVQLDPKEKWEAKQAKKTKED